MYLSPMSTIVDKSRVLDEFTNDKIITSAKNMKAFSYNRVETVKNFISNVMS